MTSGKEIIRIPSHFIAKALRNEAIYQRQSWWLIALLPLWIAVFVLVHLHHHDYDSSSSSFSTNDMKTILENQQLLQLRRLQYLKATTTSNRDEYYLSRIFFPTLAGLKHECRVVNTTSVTAECTSGSPSSSKWIQSSFDFLNSSSSSSSLSGSVIVFFPPQRQQKRHSSSLLNFLSDEEATREEDKQNESMCSQLVASSSSTVSSSTTAMVSSSLDFMRELTKTSFIIFEKCSSFYAISSNTKLHVLLNMRGNEQNDDEFIYLITVSSQNKQNALSVKRVRINDRSLEASLIVASICVLVFSVPLWIRFIKKISQNFNLIKQNEEIGTSDAKKEEKEVSQQTDQEQKQSRHCCSILKQLASSFVDFGVLSDLGIAVALLVFVGMTFARTSLMMNNNNNSRTFFDDLHALEHDFTPTLGGLLVLASGFRIFIDLHLLPVDHLLRTFRFSRKLLVLGAFFSCIWILLSFSIALFVGFSNSVGVRHHQSVFSFSRNFLQTLTAVFSLSTVGGSFSVDDDLFALQDHMSPFLVRLSVWLISGIVRFVVYSIFLAIFVDALISSPFRQIDANGEWLQKRVWCRVSTLWWVSKNHENNDDDDQKRETDISPLSYWKKIWMTDFFIFLKRKCEQIISCCPGSGTKREPRSESSLYFPEILEREARELEDGAGNKDNNKSQKMTTIRPLLSKTEYCHCSCSTSLECCWWREFIFEQAVADREHEMIEEETYAERFGSPLDRIVKVVMKTQQQKKTQSKRE